MANNKKTTNHKLFSSTLVNSTKNTRNSIEQRVIQVILLVKFSDKLIIK